VGAGCAASRRLLNRNGGQMSKKQWWQSFQQARPTPPLGATPPMARRVGWGFISLYALAYIGTILVFLAPLLVSLALKINSLVGIEQAPDSLALVTGVGAFLALFANVLGALRDRRRTRRDVRGHPQ